MQRRTADVEATVEAGVEVRFEAKFAGAIALAIAALLVLVAATGSGARTLRGAPSADYWLLTEFDWGDDPEVVYDSLEVAPGFICYDAGAEACKFVRVVVDGEQLLADFDYRDDRLWQVRFETPGLTLQQAREHLGRVLGRLSGYVGRLRGPPVLASPAPPLPSIAEKTSVPVGFWKLPDMEIRIEVERRGGKFFARACFYDPAAASAPH